jgi:hypothetical protein
LSALWPQRLFGLFGRRKTAVESAADAVYALVRKAVKRGGRVRVEDLLSASASVVGEACIAAAGDFDPRRHEHIPGSHIFSDRANALFCGDKPWEDAPPESIAGTLRESLTAAGFTRKDFPVLEEVIGFFVANIGKEEDWGRVPLSVPEDHRPYIMPLQIAYETREAVDKALSPLGDDAMARLMACTQALAKALMQTKDVLSRLVATTLALETVNGMAKTAPMTRVAMMMLMDKARAGSGGAAV